jgi:pterin-4a-carbinolamine dehydratase
MKVSSLLIENSNRVVTGSSTVDSLLESIGGVVENPSRLPVSVDQSEWVTLASPERISRTFSFSSPGKLRYFVNELLSYQERVYHHAMIAIQGDVVTVESYTHDVNGVTGQDLKLASFADEVYEDTRFFSS